MKPYLRRSIPILCFLPWLLLALLSLSPGRAAAAPVEAPSNATSADDPRSHSEGDGLRVSGLALETFFARQSVSQQEHEMIGLALRLDTTTKQRFQHWYLRLEGMMAVPFHGPDADPSLHAEAGIMYRPRFQHGPLGVGITLSAGPTLGWVHELENRNCAEQHCSSTGGEITVGAATGVALDVYVYAVTLSLQTRRRTTLGSTGNVFDTWSIGPTVSMRW